MTPRRPKLTGSIIHGRREYHAGDPVPEGADLDRLKRLGLVEGSKPDDD